MNYEKEYNKLVGKIKKAHLYAQTDSTRAVLEDIYPELKESEDERIRRTLVEYFGPEVQLDFIRGVPIKKIRDWLEKQKEQKPEWSEEDRNTLLMAATVLKANFDSDEKFKDCDYDCETLAGKLLEMRYRISPSWKPSDEQLRPLEYAIDYFKKKRNDTTYLESLYNDLKKL